MYSLYRAWFGAEECYPRLETLSPPDTVVRVGNEGEYHFVAHRSVLAAHSGYLKALLATSAVATAATREADGTAPASDGASPIVTSVTVPSTIGGDAFAPLLNYMYTGRLEVSLDNIYTVLLATHLLHMPGALEQCRAALLRLRAPPLVPPGAGSPSGAASQQQQQQQQQPQPQPQVNGGSVLRPVPNRLLAPAFCWPGQGTATPSHLYSPRHLDLPHLPALQLPPTISMLPATAPLLHKTPIIPFGTKEPSVSPPSSSSSQRRRRDSAGEAGARSASASPELVVASSASSSSARTHRSYDESSQPRPSSRQAEPSPSASSERVSVSDSGTEPLAPTAAQQLQQSHQQQQQQQQQRKRRASQQRQNSRSARNERSSSSSSTGAGSGQTPGVVYDVACCDGPVRFHRVLNENYAPPNVQSPTQQQHRGISANQCNGRASSCRETSLHSSVCHENDENEHRPAYHGSPQPSSAAHALAASNSNSNSNAENQQRLGGGSASYTCGYCRHTFKSQYCYRKHARRHLLPTADNGENSASSSVERQLLQQQQPPPRQTPPAGQQPAPTGGEGKKREVRLLDLNVQYYPCKICGSKFPSYYFVHKHRKLCHANIDESQPSPLQQQQRVTVGSDKDTDASNATTTASPPPPPPPSTQKICGANDAEQQQQPA